MLDYYSYFDNDGVGYGSAQGFCDDPGQGWVDNNIEGFTGVADTLPKYKIEWKIDVDKERAFQSGISLFDIGSPSSCSLFLSL